ncbi:MAG: DUF721 domain-containing protein [Deltaproteobacteria bacterium]|nr:DUF721 domain-containing protein [Deltaproteobacteria bacterium]
MMSAKGPTRLGHIIDSSFFSPDLETFGKGFLVYKIWPKAVGPGIAKRARPLKLSGKILSVTVDTSAWMEELKYLKEDIIKKINDELKERTVEDIVFRLGKIPEKDNATPHPAIRPSQSQRQLTQKEINAIDRLVSPIRDDELREIIRRAIKRWEL